MPVGKRPYCIRMGDESPFFIGGMWDVWHAREEDRLYTFTVLTTFPKRGVRNGSRSDTRDSSAKGWLRCKRGLTHQRHRGEKCSSVRARCSDRDRRVPLATKIKWDTSILGLTDKLPLAYAVRELNPCKGGRGCGERLEPAHRPTACLNRSVVLLDDVVQIRARSHVHAPPCGMLASQQPQRSVARPVPIKRDFAGRAIRMGGECLPEERLGRSDAAVFTQEEVDGTALLVDRSI